MQNSSASLRSIANITLNRVSFPNKKSTTLRTSKGAEGIAVAVASTFKGLTQRFNLKGESRSGSAAND